MKTIKQSNPLYENLKLQNDLEEVFNSVLESGIYHNGHYLSKFEREFRLFNGSTYASGCSSGTMALMLSLLTLKKRFDLIDPVGVLVPSLTAPPTIHAILGANMYPIFVDVDENTLLVSKNEIVKSVSHQWDAYGMIGQILMPVHLYGRPCNMSEFVSTCMNVDNFYLIEDCAQAIGSTWNNQKVGTFGDIGCFSFYPTKNLGCMGDGGMIVTDNAELFDIFNALKNYGNGLIPGYNSRLDELQAAILSVKIKHLNQFLNFRRESATAYESLLFPNSTPLASGQTFHQYVIRVKNRTEVQSALRKEGIMTKVHYRVPCHRQGFCSKLRYQPQDLPNTDKACDEILSLPMYYGLSLKTQEKIATIILETRK